MFDFAASFPWLVPAVFPVVSSVLHENVSHPLHMHHKIIKFVTKYIIVYSVKNDQNAYSFIILSYSRFLPFSEHSAL